MQMTPYLERIAREYTGLLMLNADARNDLESLPAHDAPNYHAELARFINSHLSPERKLSADDAEIVCVAVTKQMDAYCDHLGTLAPGVPKEECLDGFHGQRHL
jgi:hypothetical protein